MTMFNPGLLLERPLKLKEGRTYFIVIPNYLGQGINCVFARYYEISTQWEGMKQVEIFEPHWVVDGIFSTSIAHDNTVIPYKIPDLEEYNKNVDHFLGF